MYGFYSSQFASGGTSFQLTNKQTIKYIKNDINYNTKIYLLKFCSLQTLRSLKMMKLFENIPKIKNIRLIINSTQNYGRNCFFKTACLI